ncbi:MAG: sulfotransferase domain-containing protein [Nocardiaceae bacterium]|nr:sulfotransferase domain-containing protein [Nocardiaceae bacterium]
MNHELTGIERYTAGYDLVTKMRMLRFSTEPAMVRAAKTAMLYAKYQTLQHYWGYPPAWRLAVRKFPRSDRVMPDFACIGAIKSGTSDLATNLFAHPSIVPPFAKEIFTPVETWLPYYPTADEMRQVEAATGAARTGYFTPAITHWWLPELFHEAKPDAKVIIMLRNPVSRAYSHFKWEMIYGGPKLIKHPVMTTYDTFVDTALAMFPDPAPTACGFPVLHSGLYERHVRRWMNRFTSDQVLVVKAEDYFKRPAETLSQIHSFLELPPAEYHPLPKQNENPIEAPPETAEARAKLAEFYAPHNAKLYDLIGRDLGWS